MGGRGHGRGKRLGLCIVLALFASGFIPAGGPPAPSAGPPGPRLARAASEEAEEPDPEKVQWFREKMRISPKYLDREEGVLGMSWAHFLTMLFLVLFFIISLVAIVIRHRRTRQLLDILLKEEGKSGTED